MIKEIRIQNFKCLLDTTVELGPFTVLIGPNDSGKTSFLDALLLLAKTASGFQDTQSADKPNITDLVWQKRSERNIIWEVQGKSEFTYTYRLELRTNGFQQRERLKIADQTIFDPTPNQNVTVHERVFSPNAFQSFLSQICRVERSHGRSAEAIVRVADDLASTEKYSLNPRVMRSTAAAEERPVLLETGANLASVRRKKPLF
jgi:energy-coupling factor transporter ATP-binding protein EcfA2